MRVRRQAEGRSLRQELERKRVRLVALGCNRSQLAFRELVRECLQLPLLFGQLERDQFSAPPETVPSQGPPSDMSERVTAEGEELDPPETLSSTPVM